MGRETSKSAWGKGVSMNQLEDLLAFLENHIDEQHASRVEKLHLDALAYRDVPCLPLTLVYPAEDILCHAYADAFNDPKKMLWNELIKTVGGTSTYNAVRLKDHFPLQVRSNHGVGIIASLFGAKSSIINDQLPWVDPLTMDAIKKIISRGVPEIDRALGSQVLETNAFYLEKLSAYPRCSRQIRVTQPDLQGPFDIAHLLVGDDIFYGVYDYPELLHELLAIITQTYVDFVEALQPLVTDQTKSDAIYIHGAIYKGKAVIKDDTATATLSQDMYSAFSKQFNDRILQLLGGGSLHYCGKSRDWHLSTMDSEWLKGMNYGNPELQDLHAIWSYLKERSIPNIMWGDSLRLEQADVDFLAEVRKLDIRTGMTLCIRARDFDEASRTMACYRR